MATSEDASSIPPVAVSDAAAPCCGCGEVSAAARDGDLSNGLDSPILTNFSEPGREKYQCRCIRRPVTMQRFFDENREKLRLDIYAGDDGMERLVGEKSLNRPALALIGYFNCFASQRIQFFGTGEMSYLHDLEQEEQEEILEKIMAKNPPGILVSACDLNNLATLKRIADKHKIPVLRSQMESRDLFPEATICIESVFAVRGTIHATLVSVCGIGVLICGVSGVGKSECALALLERGHSLIADDHVEIIRHDHQNLRGSAKQMGRAMLECRGIGIVNVLDLFGARAFMLVKSIEMVVELLSEDSEVEEKRAHENRIAEIFGVRIPHYIIKVRPGREISRIVEVAAMTRVREKLGYNASLSFNERLIETMKAGAGGTVASASAQVPAA